MAECQDCGRFVIVYTNPTPNQIEVGGPAVTINCPVDDKIGNAH